MVSSPRVIASTSVTIPSFGDIAWLALFFRRRQPWRADESLRGCMSSKNPFASSDKLVQGLAASPAALYARTNDNLSEM